MEPFTTELALKLRNARRAKGLSQAALAQEAGCTQSAISMMEQGRPDALSQVTLQKMAVILDIAIPGNESEPAPPLLPAGVRQQRCPQAECPSNIPFAAGNTVVFWSKPQPSDHRGDFCAYCGEVLLKECPTCQKTLNQGGHCSHCGTAYTNPPALMETSALEWSTRQRHQISEWQALHRSTGA